MTRTVIDITGRTFNTDTFTRKTIQLRKDNGEYVDVPYRVVGDYLKLVAPNNFETFRMKDKYDRVYDTTDYRLVFYFQYAIDAYNEIVGSTNDYAMYNAFHSYWHANPAYGQPTNRYAIENRAKIGLLFTSTLVQANDVHLNYGFLNESVGVPLLRNIGEQYEEILYEGTTPYSASLTGNVKELMFSTYASAYAPTVDFDVTPTGGGGYFRVDYNTLNDPAIVNIRIGLLDEADTVNSPVRLPPLFKQYFSTGWSHNTLPQYRLGDPLMIMTLGVEPV